MPSEKTPMVDYLYDRAVERGDMVITQEHVRAVIEHFNDKEKREVLSPRNIPNFFKDLLRGERPERNWPPRLAGLGIDGRQVVGEGRSFEFVPFEEGQTLPLQASFRPNPTLTPHRVESVSLPLSSKVLGRVDETWLIQVAVNLRVVETHFAANSNLQVKELVHLQTGVKLGKSELDAMFLARVERDGALVNVLVTCEAKQQRDHILDHQLVGQVVAAYKSVRQALDVALIVPIAIKAVPPEGRIYLAEFQPWTPAQAEAEEADRPSLELAAEGMYQLNPPVPGVGYRVPKPRAPRKPRAAGKPRAPRKPRVSRKGRTSGGDAPAPAD